MAGIIVPLILEFIKLVIANLMFAHILSPDNPIEIAIMTTVLTSPTFNSFSDMEDMARMQAHAGQAADLLKALANEHRLMIMCTLLGGELCVSDLNAKVSLSQSALSQHLANLREAGLVRTRKESQTVFYAVNGDEASKIIAVLKSIYCPQL